MGGGVNLPPNFQKNGEGLDRSSIFRGGVAGKERVTFFAGGGRGGGLFWRGGEGRGGGGLQFTEKNKLKFEIFSDACLCHNSKLNWEILRI